MTRKRAFELLSSETSWQVVKENKDVFRIKKEFGQKKRRIVDFIITYTKEGLILQHPNYLFRSTISHFSAVENDVRLILNKAFLKSIVKSLRKIEIWECIINKDFLKVNSQNNKSDKGKVKKELSFLLR